MLSINFAFSGYTTDLDIEHLVDQNNEIVDVSNWNKEKIEDALNARTLFIQDSDLNDALELAHDIELSDFEIT